MNLKRLQSIVMLASGLVFAASLGLFAWAGLAVRYWADDYCYGATVRVDGLLAGIARWYVESGNRLSTLAGVALSEAFGMSAIRFVPLAVLALLVLAWVVFWGQAVPGRRLAGLWLALVQVYFLALLAPDRLQTIYWRMGTLHYTLPMALLLFNLAMLAHFWRTARPPWWLIVLSGLLAGFAAGFSETFAALQAGLYGAGLLALAWLGWARRERLGSRWLLVGSPLLGTLLMMAVMASAPANAWRQAAMPPPDNLLLVIPYSLRYALDFIFSTLDSRPVPFAVYMLGMAGFALLIWGGGRPPRLAPKAAALWLGLSLLLTYGLIVCSFAPSAYAGLLYPAGRAQMPAAFILLVGLGAAAGLVALLLQAALSRLAGRLLGQAAPAALVFAALLLLAGFSLYPLRAASIPLADRADLTVRAERWDERDAQIRAALAQGAAEVQVRQVDVVQSLEDIGPEPTFWINACAAQYYGAGSLIAIP